MVKTFESLLKTNAGKIRSVVIGFDTVEGSYVNFEGSIPACSGLARQIARYVDKESDSILEEPEELC